MLQQAHFLQINQDYHEALKAYCSYIAQNPEDFEALIARSIAYYNSGRFEQAIDDAQSAILVDRKRYEGFFHRGKAHFGRGKVQAALIDLEEAYTRATGDAQRNVNVQIEKCKAELKNKQFQEIADRKNFTPVTTVPIEQKEKVQQEKPQNLTNVLSQTGKVIYKWYQTDLKVGIEINQTLHNPSLLKTKFENKKVYVSFPLQDSTLFELEIELWGEIAADKSKGTVGLNQIEIILEKQVKSQNWPKLEHDEQLSQASVPVQVQQQASYPSSSKIKKDWSKIDKEIETDIEKHKEEYGEDPLNTLFKQIYQNGDEKTKQAMIKSMQTSGGTVLSTNWDEVKDKDYQGKDRPSPPKGQERKKL